MIRGMLSVVMAGALCGVMVAQASAFNLTGTWQGTQVCQFFTDTGQKDLQVFRRDVITITQIDDDVRIFMGSVKLLYTGKSLTNGTDPNKGEVAFRLCGLSDDPETVGEMGRAKVSTQPSPVGDKFKATSIFSTAEEVDTCVWDYRRLALTDPKVPPCP